VKKFLLFLVAALALAACNRIDAGAQSVEAPRVAESADDSRKAKPLPDAQLSDIVRSAIISDSSLDANRIDVENKGGNVALYGAVDTPEQREKVERIVNSVGGVKSVANHLTVSQRESDRTSGTGATAPPDPDVQLPAPR
jgi:osmotically-inducible protein OsmY